MTVRELIRAALEFADLDQEVMTRIVTRDEEGVVIKAKKCSISRWSNFSATGTFSVFPSIVLESSELRDDEV